MLYDVLPVFMQRTVTLHQFRHYIHAASSNCVLMSLKHQTLRCEERYQVALEHVLLVCNIVFGRCINPDSTWEFFI